MDWWWVLVLLAIVVVPSVLASKMTPEWEVEHRCDVRYPELPDGASEVRARWQCPVCKQRWAPQVQVGTARADRVGRPSSKWQRDAVKAVKAQMATDPAPEPKGTVLKRSVDQGEWN